MTYVKKSDIEMLHYDGVFQLSIGDHCVTNGDDKTLESCYKSYIVELINSIEKTRSSLTHNTGF